MSSGIGIRLSPLYHHATPSTCTGNPRGRPATSNTSTRFPSYKKLYLNAKNKNDEFHKLSDTPAADGQITYPSDQEAETRFVTEPLESDMTIAGYCKANLFVSSTHNDMVVLTYLYVLDEDGCRIPFVMDLNPATPIRKGGLKISHRKQDEALRTEYRPYHTHRKEDVQKLVPGEIAEAEIEILPTTARLKKGWRLEFVIMPKNSAGELFDPRDNYSEGALNTVYGRRYQGCTEMGRPQRYPDNVKYLCPNQPETAG
ncbi:MAG: hypothetical protein LIO96_02865 [Lachnospiraceae bacterium]|nr:hypothetical protein [Lachnospiraceae bacterium]